MDFKQEKKTKNNEVNYHIENLKVARDFSKKLILEFKSLVKSIVLFGSNTHDTLNKDSDIDLMIVLDNVSVFVTDELREAYKIIVNNIGGDANSKLHIMTVNFSDFWDMSRKGDPVLVNILRFGLPIYDTNLVEPMQYLLETGRIKPSRETVHNYMARSNTLLEETNKHLHEAVLDLYYAIVDIVHATLMIEGENPPSPKEMPKIFKKVFNKKPLGKYSVVINEFYKTAKSIEHGGAKNVNGKKYDELHKKATKMISDLTKYNKKKISKKDIFEL